MNPSYTFNHICTQVSDGVVRPGITELAAKLQFGESSLMDLLQDSPDNTSFSFDNHKFFVQGEFKDSYDDKMGYDPSSNFRDKTLTDNNRVVSNWVQVFEMIRKNNGHLVSTSVARPFRTYTLKMGEDGSVAMYDNSLQKIDEEFTRIFQEFLIGIDVSKDDMIDMRQASKGAHFNSYLADMMSFIIAMDEHYHPEMFEEKYFQVVVKRSGTDVERQLRERGDLTEEQIQGELLDTLTPKVDQRGKEWTPKDGFDYLFFEEASIGLRVKCLKDGSVAKIYNQMKELLKKEENGTKQMLREFLKSKSVYNRWSDYLINDVDDAFSIYMLYYSFKYNELDQTDMMIVEELKHIINGFKTQ